MKSHEQDLMTVCECIYKDAAAKCTTDKVNMIRDLCKIRERITHEGLSFLTITLPDFGKEFEKTLSEEQVTSTSFPGWKKKSCLPAFLQGFTRLVFNVETGGLLNDPCISAIEGIRQLAYSFKKMSLPCTPERESMALHRYQEVECILSEYTMPTRIASLFNKISDLLWGNIFCEDYDSHRYIPRHGPGQTAEYISGNRKYTHRNWTERLEPFFPSDIYLMSCYTQLFDKTDGIDCVQFAKVEDELPVRVVCVPKTLKGPRIIAIEPVCMQYAQQALSSYIIKKLEISEMTAGHINFSDQTINQKLAMSASVDKSFSTLDLSDASDRVPLSMVTTMLRSNDNLLSAILACRSQAAQIPSGKILNLMKFASMGSALCFPIEAMYFYTVILTSLFEKHELPVTLRNIYKISRDVYVYGDDIIIPTNEVEAVMEALTMFNCKVNTTKSFWKGKFRESCGMDAYDGHDVTPTYVRHMRPHNRGDVSGLLSWIATSNLFYKRGYWLTASYMKDIVEALLGKLPIIYENSPGIGWLSFQKYFSFERWNKKLCRYENYTYTISPSYKEDTIDGWSALLKFFLTAELRDDSSLGSVDEKHLSRSPRSGTSTLKRRWVPPY